MMRKYIEYLWTQHKERQLEKRLKEKCLNAAREYLKQQGVRKLQIGTGPNRLQGWFNTDISPAGEGIYHLDASQNFPFQENTFDYIFSEHQIEHFTYYEGLQMLKECRRVLKPGGRIRIITPDMDIIIALRSPQKSDIQRDYVRWHIENFYPEMARDRDIFVINNAFSGFGHRFLYDYETLKESIEKAGFTNVLRMPYGQSSDENLRAIDWRASDRMTSFTGLCVEAEKI